MKILKALIFQLILFAGTSVFAQTNYFERVIRLEGSHEEGNRIIKTQDGNVLITGSIDEGHKNIFIVKVDNKGDSLWTRGYGSETVDDSGSDLVFFGDGYAICGSTKSYSSKGQSDAFILTIDEDGKWIEYPKVFGSEANDIATRIIQTRDGNFVFIIEKRLTLKYSETFIYKIDKKGNRVWIASLPNHNPTFGASIIEETNGDIIFGGTSTNQLEKDRDILIARINGKDGQVKWSKIITGRDNYNESLQSMIKSKSGDYLLTGIKLTPARRYLFYYVLDQDGNLKVDELFNFGNEQFSLSSPKQMIESSDGNVVIVGEKSGKGFVFKLTAAGERISFHTYDGLFSSIIELDNGDLMMTGQKRNESNFWDVYLCRTGSDGQIN